MHRVAKCFIQRLRHRDSFVVAGWEGAAGTNCD
jgi:hypothetical protein